MKKNMLILVSIFFIAAASASAAEKGKIQAQIDAARISVEALAAKIGDNREAGLAVEQARASLKKASDVFSKGRQLFGINVGFGDLKPEAEDEIKSYLEITDASLATANSRLEKSRTAAEFEVLDKQLKNARAKMKVFDDRKAELEKLKADAAKCLTASKEVETLKVEKAALTSQIEMFMAERGKADKQKVEQADLGRKLDEAKAENLRLSGQVEKQFAEIKSLTSQLADAKKTSAETPAVPNQKP